MIVKVIRGTMDDPPLAFIRDKTIVRELHVTGPLAAKLGKDRKAFFRAKWADEGKTLDIGDRVPDEDW